MYVGVVNRAETATLDIRDRLTRLPEFRSKQWEQFYFVKGICNFDFFVTKAIVAVE
jgi:hypothetical protein